MVSCSFPQQTTKQVSLWLQVLGRTSDDELCRSTRSIGRIARFPSTSDRTLWPGRSIASWPTGWAIHPVPDVAMETTPLHSTTLYLSIYLFNYLSIFLAIYLFIYLSLFLWDAQDIPCRNERISRLWPDEMRQPPLCYPGVEKRRDRVEKCVEKCLCPLQAAG